MACYPGLPDNRIIVDGVDICSKFGLVLIDGYTLSPPAEKSYTLDIPGANGSIDLTDKIMGDTAYENRSQEFTFDIILAHDYESGVMKTDQDVEYIKTQVSNYLHGKAFDYQLTFDPDYTYHGRFSVDSYAHDAYSSALLTTIDITIDANPYKKKANKTYRFNAYGGKWYDLESGRRKVRPTIQCQIPTEVQCNDKCLTVPSGTYRLNEIFFSEGVNKFYINSYQPRTTKWEELKPAAFTPAYRMSLRTILAGIEAQKESWGITEACVVYNSATGYYYQIGYYDTQYAYFASRTTTKPTTFTPKYRMKRSTIIAEQDGSDPLTTSTVVYNSATGYYYPIGLLKGDYAYFASRTKITPTGSDVKIVTIVSTPSSYTSEVNMHIITLTDTPEEYTTAIGGNHAMTWTEAESNKIWWDKLEHLDLNEDVVPMSWKDIGTKNDTWASYISNGTKWSDLNYTPSDDDDATKYTTYLSYGWEDL
jgi:hypothetical protein